MFYVGSRARHEMDVTVVSNWDVMTNGVLMIRTRVFTTMIEFRRNNNNKIDSHVSIEERCYLNMQDLYLSGNVNVQKESHQDKVCDQISNEF